MEPPIDLAVLAPRRRSSGVIAVDVQLPGEPPELTPELARVLLRVLQCADRRADGIREAGFPTDGVAS